MSLLGRRRKGSQQTSYNLFLNSAFNLLYMYVTYSKSNLYLYRL